MTVRELIATLMTFPPDATVYLPDRDEGPFECGGGELQSPDPSISIPGGVHLHGVLEDEDE